MDKTHGDGDGQTTMMKKKELSFGCGDKTMVVSEARERRKRSDSEAK